MISAFTSAEIHRTNEFVFGGSKMRNPQSGVLWWGREWLFVWGSVRNKHRLLSEPIWEMTLLTKIPSKCRSSSPSSIEILDAVTEPYLTTAVFFMKQVRMVNMPVLGFLWGKKRGITCIGSRDDWDPDVKSGLLGWRKWNRPVEQALHPTSLPFPSRIPGVTSNKLSMKPPKIRVILCSSLLSQLRQFRPSSWSRSTDRKHCVEETTFLLCFQLNRASRPRRQTTWPEAERVGASSPFSPVPLFSHPPYPALLQRGRASRFLSPPWTAIVAAKHQLTLQQLIEMRSVVATDRLPGGEVSSGPREMEGTRGFESRPTQHLVPTLPPVSHALRKFLNQPN